MKVFLSWSGDMSHKVACVLRDWLPSVIQAVKPYVSSEDIDKGARWSTDIAQELDQSTYGILCITPANIEAPWINFEAGALSKSIDRSFVAPFLFRVKRSDVQGPLLQFQSTVYEQDDVHKLIDSINNRLAIEDRLQPTQVEKAFDIWWPVLQHELHKLPDDTVATPIGDTTSPDRQAEILEEILDLARSHQRLLSTPEALLPPGYVEWVIRQTQPTPRVQREMENVLGRIRSGLDELNQLIEGTVDVEPDRDALLCQTRELISYVNEGFHVVRRPPPLSPTRRSAVTGP
jgi:hypothetical protein